MYDPRRDIVQEITQEKSPKFQIVSLGDHCLVAKYLSLFNMRDCSYPFDWIQASCKMVEHCLKDEFKNYCSLYSEDFYSKMTSREIFKHHNVAKSIDYHKRCVMRFRNLQHLDKKAFCATCYGVDLLTWQNILLLLKELYNIECKTYLICLGCCNDESSPIENLIVLHWHDVKTSRADLTEKDQIKFQSLFDKIDRQIFEETKKII